MRRAVALSIGAFSLLVTAKASAAYHVMMITEVFTGAPSAPDASYVMLQMYQAGQNFTDGHVVTVYDFSGNLIDSVTLTNVTNGNDQDRILIGTSTVAASFGVTPDFATLKKLPGAGGLVCFDPKEAPVDCVAYGNYAGPDPGGAGGITTPFGPLNTGQAAKRKITAGNPALLDAADDTGNSSADFAYGEPKPRNNSGVTGTLPDGGTASSSSGGTTDSGTPPVDSGVSTVPSEGGTLVDSGASSTSSGGGTTDDGGCAVASTPGNDRWAGLGVLVTAALGLILRGRRRRSA